jgi:enterochelin esterase family protein
MNEEPTSRRIAELRVRVAAGDVAAVAAFWRRAAEEGTPIVEPISGDETQRLVTFVFRAPGPLANVAIFPGIEHAYVMAQNQMTKLPGTDVWYRTYRARADLRATYYISPNDPLRSSDEEIDSGEEAAYIAERTKAWLTDPLNSKQFTFEPGWPAHSLIELPDAPTQPYLAKREDVPEGTIEREDLGRDPFGEGRRIWTYLPPGYQPGAGPYPLVVVFDGWGGRKLGVHTTLDNVIADGVIPPTVCVMIHQLDRNIELRCNEHFADWLARDFVPSWVRQRYAVTDDPARTVVSGTSLGGLGAAWCAFRHPEVFGNVLSQSGSYWWRPGAPSSYSFVTRTAPAGPKARQGDPYEWLTRQYEASPCLPLRLHMDVGLLEDQPRPGACPTMLDANRRMRDVLRTKGYDLQYVEYNGGHDSVSWRGTFADGLAFLLGAATRTRGALKGKS